MSDQNSNTPDPSDAVPGYEPPRTPDPAAPATPPSFTPPPAGEPPAYTPPSAAEPPSFSPPAGGGYEPPTGGYEAPSGGAHAAGDFGSPQPGSFGAAEGGYPPPGSGGYEQPPAGGAVPPPGGGFPPPGGSYPPPGGSFPPPGGSYPPPPPGGSFPPPPPPPPGGGYGQPPYGQDPGYSGGGYGAPAQFSVGAAFNYGWSKFVANIGPVLLVAVVAFAATFLVQMIGNLLTAGMSTVSVDPNTGTVRMAGGILASIVAALFGLISYVVAAVVSMGLIRAALDITYGREITLGSVFRFDDLVPFLIAQLLVGLMATVGLILCVIPGLVVLFFTQFTSYFVLDKKLGAVDAIKASFRLVNANLGSLLGLFLVALLAAAIGALLCGVGLLVAYPVIGIAFAYAYRTLQNEPVAP